MPQIGVLALQGAFAEHATLLRQVGVEPVEVRSAGQLDLLDGLIIPGGESTTIARLMSLYDLDEGICRFAGEGHPVWGTCAGLILLARSAIGRPPPRLELMDIEVRRNAFGRQVDSFVASLEVPTLGGAPFPAVFIRAPIIERAGPEVEVLARLDDGKIVAARQRTLLATAFHPELTADDRLHRLFLDMVEAAKPANAGEAEAQMRGQGAKGEAR